MKLLEKERYNELIGPLSKMNINNFFARSVIENFVSGKVYVDNINEPKTFYIVHPYGMSLLFGDCNNNEFNASFRDYALNINKTRDKFEWMQAFPNDWDSVLNLLFKDCIIRSSDNFENKENGIIELNIRINFRFNLDKYLAFKKKNIVAELNIVRTNKQIFQDMEGSVIPSFFWDNADDFYENGVGFSLFHENKLASTAYSTFINDNKLELGIETVKEFRDKGFAQYTCSSLIDYCIVKNYEPIWACRLENIGSFKLAQKLGFEISAELPFYRLSK